MKKRKILLIVLALVLLAAASVGSALAYFTANDTAEGEKKITLRPTTTVEETFDSWTKHLTITNTASAEDGAPCFVRARAYFVDVTVTGRGDGWTKSGDWYYYGTPLEPGQSAPVLDLAIDNIPSDPRNGDTFNVVVVYEAAPVSYDAEGNAFADWNQSLDVLSVKEGG